MLWCQGLLLQKFSNSTSFPRIALASAKISHFWHFIFVAGVSLLRTYSLFILTSALNAYSCLWISLFATSPHRSSIHIRAKLSFSSRTSSIASKFRERFAPFCRMGDQQKYQMLTQARSQFLSFRATSTSFLTSVTYARHIRAISGWFAWIFQVEWTTGSFIRYYLLSRNVSINYLPPEGKHMT